MVLISYQEPTCRDEKRIFLVLVGIMIIPIPKNCFCSIALLLSLLLQRYCTFPQMYTPSLLSVHADWNSYKLFHENTLSKQLINNKISKQAPYHVQPKTGKITNQAQTEKYIAIITLVIATATILTRLTSIICKKFYKIDKLDQEIKAQNTRINKFERNSELYRCYIDEVVTLLGHNIDDLRQKMDNEIGNKNQEIDLLKTQARNNKLEQKYKLKSGKK